MSRIIAVDFDGTCVTHEFPAIGRDIGAVPVLRRLAEEGHRLILWTMRSGEHLEAAVQWFSDNGIQLWGVNRNPDQHTWSESPKAYAQMYIDDAALGTPLVLQNNGRPYVDWQAVSEILFGEKQ
jgi:hypothetical protein